MTRSINKKPFFLLFQLGVILLPLVEIYRSFFGDTLQFFGIAAEEALLLLFWGGLLCAGLILALGEKRRRPLLFALAAVAVFLVYLVLHAWNASEFDASLLPGAEPSLVREAYYLVRTYFLPGSLVLSAFLLDVPKKELFSALRIAAFIITLAVILPTLFGFSFASYADGNVFVNGGFFSWFSLGDDADFARYTAKGLFSDANAVGAVLFGLCPFASVAALKKGRWQDLVLLFLVGFSSVAVGTKIASFGFFLSAGAMLAVAVLRVFLEKEDRKARALRAALFALVALLCVPLFLLSPGKRLQDQRKLEAETADRPTEDLDEIEELTDEFLGEEALSADETLLLSEYLQDHYWDHFIDPWFLELYPVECDPSFWLEAVSRDNVLNADSRSFKLEMADRILERNARSADRFLGVGHSAGIPYAERDYLGQTPVFGLFGLLVLIGPYFVLLIGGVALCLMALVRKKDVLTPAAATLAVASFLVTAYFAGHVFDTVFSTYFLAAAGAAILSLRNRYDK